MNYISMFCEHVLLIDDHACYPHYPTTVTLNILLLKMLELNHNGTMHVDNICLHDQASVALEGGHMHAPGATYA